MSDLMEFLAARLGEDEAAAKLALEVRADGWYEVAQQAVACTDTIEIGPACQHIARHDPARVLWEIEARREILAAWQDNELERGDACTYTDGLADGLGLAVRYLITVYSDHPDYCEEWEALGMREPPPRRGSGAGAAFRMR